MVNDLLQASDSGHVSILSLLDLSAAFDTIDHDILIRRLHTTFGCSGTVLDWFTSYLSFRTQSVLVGHASTPSALKCGVPQGSVLGPLLFTLYTQSLTTVICQSGHSYHFFADDSQLHNSSTPSDFPVLVHSLKDCIEDVAEWMCDSMLKMNHDKTELIAVGTMPKISQVTLSLTPVSISGHNIPFSQSARNLGVFIDKTLVMEEMEDENDVQAGSRSATNCNFARCEQPDNKNTRNSTLYFTSNRVVALFTGGRSSATIHYGEDD